MLRDKEESEMVAKVALVAIIALILIMFAMAGTSMLIESTTTFQ